MKTESDKVKAAKQRCEELGFGFGRDRSSGFWISGSKGYAGGDGKRYVAIAEDLDGWINYLNEHGF